MGRLGETYRRVGVSASGEVRLLFGTAIATAVILFFNAFLSLSESTLGPNYSSMNAFSPGVAVIAGVGPGLGASLARRIAKEGCRLALLARSSDFLETLSKELRRRGTETLSIPTDIGEADQVTGAFQRIREQLGSVDLLINNASASGPFGQPFVEISAESLRSRLAGRCTRLVPLLASSRS